MQVVSSDRSILVTLDHKEVARIVASHVVRAQGKEKASGLYWSCEMARSSDDVAATVEISFDPPPALAEREMIGVPS